jgi:hypothetical protein
MTRVIFKYEDEVAGRVPVGPVWVFADGADPFAPRPFDPNREPDPWVTLPQAQKIAAEHGVELEVS